MQDLSFCVSWEVFVVLSPSLLGPAHCSGDRCTAAWAGALLLLGLAHCCCLGWRTVVAWAGALLRGLPHRCLGRGVLQRGRCTAGAGALLQFTMRPPSSLRLALQWALRRARSGHACSIVCGSFATQSDDGVLPHIRSRWGRRRTEAGCRWPSKDDRLPPAVGRRLSASGR